MIDLFESNRLKNKNILIATIIVLATSYLVMYPEVFGMFSILTSWTYLTIGGVLSMIFLVGHDKTKLFFRNMKKNSWKWIIISVILSFLVSILFILIGSLFNISVAENASMEGIGETTTPFWILLIEIVTTIFSLIGEEVITASIAIILFYYAEKRFNSNISWVLSAIISAIIFGLMHYGVYDGNIFQCIFVIGIGRLPLTYAWRKTGSLWGGIWAHVIYDYIIIGILYLGL
ncbi:CPBP family intramembrane glutamic endopeptidase [Enterococcus faecalis]